MRIERRKDRSDKEYSAVIKQLQAVATDGQFQNILIADSEGLVIAASNNDPENDSLGVEGILAVNRAMLRENLPGMTYVCSEPLQDYALFIYPFTLLEQTVLLVAKGKETGEHLSLFNRAVSGAKRIMEN
jgi:hypothetical protein